MSATMKKVAPPPLPTLREAGAACATFARAEFAAQERGDDSGQWSPPMKGLQPRLFPCRQHRSRR